MHKDDGTETIIPADYAPPVRRRRRRVPAEEPGARGPGPLAWTFLLLLIGLPLAAVLLTRPVEVTTIPTEARVSIDGAVLAFDERWIALKGPHRISVTAPGYLPWTRDIRVGRPQDDRIEAVLTPMPGALEVSVPDVEMAEVRLAGGDWQSAPARFDGLDAGAYQIEARAPRYKSASAEANVRGLDQTDEFVVELEPAWGTLALTLSPELGEAAMSAELWVDGDLRVAGLGTAETALDLMEGEHRVEIRAPKFAVWQESIQMIAGTSLRVGPVTLLPARATLKVETRPDRANLVLDGVFIGQAPLEFGLGPGDSHSIKAFLDGYKTKETGFSVEPGETRKLVVTLEPEFATVRVSVQPEDAAISILVDGEPVDPSADASTQGLRVSAGQHTLTASAEGYAPASVEMELLAGDVRDVALELMTEAAAAEAERLAAETARAERLASLPESVSGPLDMSFRLIRPHAVTLGSSRREPGRRANERLRDVDLTLPFYIATHEVTNAQFHAFDAAHESGYVGGLSLGGADQPVVNVTWAKAAAFANWMSAQAKLTPVYIIEADEVIGFHPEADGYRLPTEAEWAFVARSGGSEPWRNFPWGMTLPPPLKSGNYADLGAAELVARVLPGYRDGYAVTAPVGSFAPDRYGVYDLGGNVAEWVHDVYVLDPAQGRVLSEPMGEQAGTLHSQRGSSWAHARETELRFAYRGYGSQARNDLGFRLARRVQ